MVITHAEERFRWLLKLWLVLFGGGVLVMAGAILVPAGKAYYQDNPALAGTLVGQILLYLTSLYIFSGIRDNEVCALVLTWFKVVSGSAMFLLLLSRGPATGAALPVIGGALLDYLMGGLDRKSTR